MMAEQKNIELSQGSAVDAGNHVSSKKKYILHLFTLYEILHHHFFLTSFLLSCSFLGIFFNYFNFYFYFNFTFNFSKLFLSLRVFVACLIFV